MTKQKVLSSNMAATPFSFGSLGIGCKPPIVKCLYDRTKSLVTRLISYIVEEKKHFDLSSMKFLFLTVIRFSSSQKLTKTCRPTPSRELARKLKPSTAAFFSVT